MTVASLLEELEEARKLALKRGQPSAAVQASMGKARILELIIDRREVGDPGAFDDKTDEELMEEARNRAAALGCCLRDPPLTHGHRRIRLKRTVTPSLGLAGPRLVEEAAGSRFRPRAERPTRVPCTAGR